jgi:hypothetical protein
MDFQGIEAPDVTSRELPQQSAALRKLATTPGLASTRKWLRKQRVQVSVPAPVSFG